MVAKSNPNRTAAKWHGLVLRRAQEPQQPSEPFDRRQDTQAAWDHLLDNLMDHD